jgi:hypothetical protein
MGNPGDLNPEKVRKVRKKDIFSEEEEFFLPLSKLSRYICSLKKTIHGES